MTGGNGGTEREGTLRVHVVSAGGPVAAPSHGSGAGYSWPPISARAVVTGPRRLTGDGPYRATYRVNNTRPTDTEWVLDGASVRYGSHVTLTLAPGVHHLHVVYVGRNGLSNATFAGNETRIAVDPGPSITVGTLRGRDGLVANVTADDPVPDLRSLSLSLDGHRVARATTDHRGHLALHDSEPLVPGGHVVVVTARNAHGQTARYLAVVYRRLWLY